MIGNLISRNVTISGRRTSLRLEDDMWCALAEVCKRERVSIHQLCTAIDGRRGEASRTSAVRAFLVTYYRAAATEKGHANAKHGRLAAAKPAPRVNSMTDALERLFCSA